MKKFFEWVRKLADSLLPADPPTGHEHGGPT